MIFDASQETATNAQALAHWCCGNPCLATAVASAVCLLLGLSLGTEGDGALRSGLALLVLGWCGLGATLTVVCIKDASWGDFLALVPPALVVRHVISLRITRRRGMAAGDDDRHADRFDKRSFVQVFADARAAQDREFGWDVLAVRYGFPAALMAILGVAEFHLLRPTATTDLLFTTEVLKGARLAALGAYTYVLVYLGDRSVRRDVTSGAAAWSAVTMSLGPVLGGVFAGVWSRDSAEGWTAGAMYFVVGLSPRYATAAIAEAVKRLWLARAETPAPTRMVALTEIGGITPEIADRLKEEGILDASGLAMAAPTRLYRNTAFDERQILSWIDEALLTTFFPDDWRAIRSADVSGAIDLAARYGRVRRAVPKSGDTFDLLAKRINNAAFSPELLREVASLIYEDAQVELIWTLYQSHDDGRADRDGHDAEDDSSAPASSSRTFAIVASVCAILAVLFWGSAWPLDLAQMEVLMASVFCGAGLVAVIGATRPFEPCGTRGIGTGVGWIMFLVAAAAYFDARTAVYSAGLVLLGTGAAILGGAAAATVRRNAGVTRIVVAIVTQGGASPELWIDGVPTPQPTGPDPWIEVMPGRHRARVRCAGYRDFDTAFHTARLPRKRLVLAPRPARPTGVAVTLVPPPPGPVTLTATSIDDPNAGPKFGSNGVLWLDHGVWSIVADADGFETATKVLVVDAEKPQELRMRLKETLAPLHIVVPQGSTIAAVEIDRVEHVAASSGDADLLVRSGRRNVFVRWVDGSGAQGVASKSQEQSRDVIIPREGCTLTFPAPQAASDGNAANAVPETLPLQ